MLRPSISSRFLRGATLPSLSSTSSFSPRAQASFAAQDHRDEEDDLDWILDVLQEDGERPSQPTPSKTKEQGSDLGRLFSILSSEPGKTEETNDSSFSDLFPSLNISPSSENRIFLSSEQIPPVIRDFIPKQSPLATGMRPAQLFEDPLVKKQKELELEAVNKSKIDYRETVVKMMELGSVVSLRSCQKLLLQWFLPLVGAIKLERNNIFRALESGSTLPPYATLLLVLDPEKLAILTIHSVIGQIIGPERNGASLSTVISRLSELLDVESNLEVLHQRNPRLKAMLLRSNLSLDKLLHKSHAYTQREKDAKGLKSAAYLVDLFIRTAYLYVDQKGDVVYDHKPITRFKGRGQSELIRKYYQTGIEYLFEEMNEEKKTKEKIAEEFLSKWIGDPKLEDIPKKKSQSSFRALVVETEKNGPHKKNILKIDQRVYDEVSSSLSDHGALLARHVPMVIPPRPWTSPFVGGYEFSPTHLVRDVGSELQRNTVKAAMQELDEVYDCVSVLGKTPWKINTDILHVVEELWSRGGGQAEVPSIEDLPPPPEPADESGRGQYYRQRAKVKQLNYDRHGLRCTLRYKLEIANSFKNYESFYFPHNLDFRGRAYPIPPHFNHMGSDLDRGLLRFAEKRPIGLRGLFWMKVHLANLFGHNKVSFLDRVEWVDDHYDLMIDSALNPLDGQKWWMKADDPWQALATCMELRDVLSLKPAKQATYESSLPIHMDGSCNGLQHYAALGGDIDGGTQVNLLPGNAPRDVYMGACEIVARQVAEDAANGHPIAQILDNRVERKIVKQTIMTSVYGVTFIGARQQIQNALEDRGFLEEEQLWDCSVYLTRLAFMALRELFSGAKSLMDWLGTSASLIAHSGVPVMWTTPLGLPVVQPYRQTRTAEVRTALQTIRIIESADSFPINTKKQRSAFPPNYVHSLDSTHMMMTARSMGQANLTFSAVHDSFWTHPSDVDRMNVILRKTFKELHQRPLLETLLEEFQTLNPSVEFPPLPEKGDLDLELVLRSPYFFH